MARDISSAALAMRLARRRAAFKLGRAAEAVAAEFLRSQGLEIIERNFRRRHAEIDLVARDHDTLIVVEVRSRSSNQFGGAAASVDARKQRRIVLGTHLMLQRNEKFTRMRVRFDVVIVEDVLAEKPRVRWIQQAFLAT